MKKPAFILLAVTTLVLAGSTFAEKIYGADFVNQHLYGAWWFYGLWLGPGTHVPVLPVTTEITTKLPCLSPAPLLPGVCFRIARRFVALLPQAAVLPSLHDLLFSGHPDDLFRSQLFPGGHAQLCLNVPDRGKQ